MDLGACSTLLVRQSGVVSRRQLTAAGVRPHDLQRMLRRRDLVRLHDGVFVDHTGAPTWVQRAWGGVLLAWPAALTHDSALRFVDGPGRSDRDDTVIHLAVDRHRAVRVPVGYRLHRTSDFDAKVTWNTSPPRIRIEEALVDVAANAADEFRAIATLADAIRSRRTTADRIRDALDSRQRVARRTFLRDVLVDLGHGTCSVLEHGYLTLVERPHGLPVAERQLLDSTNGPLYRDVAYAVGQVVELDGRMWHDSPQQRDADLDRDLDAAVDRLGTVRLGWGQVFGRPCATAHRVARLLRSRGWAGSSTTCIACREQRPLAG
jgi:hypothetical protein